MVLLSLPTKRNKENTIYIRVQLLVFIVFVIDASDLFVGPGISWVSPEQDVIQGNYQLDSLLIPLTKMYRKDLLAFYYFLFNSHANHQSKFFGDLF